MYRSLLPLRKVFGPISSMQFSLTATLYMTFTGSFADNDTLGKTHWAI